MFDSLPIFSIYGAAGMIEVVGSLFLLPGLFVRPVAFLLAWAWATLGMEVLGPWGFLSYGPLLAWSALTFRIADQDEDVYSWRDEERPDGVVHDFDDVWPSLLGVGLYGFLAWVLYRLASRRFEREGRG